MDVEESLAAKLADDDIYAILAVNMLRRLKLAGCIDITGTGLVYNLEQINLSTNITFQVKIYEEIVLIVLRTVCCVQMGMS